MARIIQRFWRRSILLILVMGTSMLCLALMRPAARLPAPLATSENEPPQLVRDPLGRVVFRNFRTVEAGVLYAGTAIPTTYQVVGADGAVQHVYADQTAFEKLRSVNVRHVLSMQEDQEAFFREEGYLKHWSVKTGHVITASWAPVVPADTYGVSDRSALHAAAELLTHFKGNWPVDGAVYVHSDTIDPIAVVVGAFEIWRNRGWAHADAVWAQAERRFQRMIAAQSGVDGMSAQQRRDAFRRLRRRLHTIAEL